MRKLYIIIILNLLVWHVKGQDLHFSQYHSSPMHLNPSMVGLLHAGNVITLNYRDQWRPVLGSAGSFHTVAGTFEKRIKTGNNFFGCGLGLWQDKAGALTQNEAKLAVSYARLLARVNKGNYYMIGGGQGGVMQNVVENQDRRWLSQYDGNGGFDASKPGENIDYTHKTLLDVSMGMTIFALYDNQNYWVLGGALHHLNKADLSVTKYSILPSQYMRYTAHALGSIYLGGSHFKVIPSILMMKQGPTVELLPSMALKYIIDRTDYRSFQLGGSLRLVNKLEENKLMNDAFVAFMRIDWAQYGLGFSYDVNISTLNVVNKANNAIELALTYRFENDFLNKKMVTPRYF